MAKSARYDISFVAGDDYQITVKLLEDGSAIDTSGYTFKAQVRDAFYPDGSLLADFAVSAVTGGATLSLTDSQTRSLASYSHLVWDVQSSSPDVRTWLSGNVTVQPEVTE